MLAEYLIINLIKFKTIFLKVQKLFYNAMYSESVPDRYSDGYAAMERVGDIIYRCENHDINTGHSISVSLNP